MTPGMLNVGGGRSEHRTSSCCGARKSRAWKTGRLRRTVLARARLCLRIAEKNLPSHSTVQEIEDYALDLMDRPFLETAQPWDA